MWAFRGNQPKVGAAAFLQTRVGEKEGLNGTLPLNLSLLFAQTPAKGTALVDSLEAQLLCTYRDCTYSYSLKSQVRVTSLNHRELSNSGLFVIDSPLTESAGYPG